MNSIRKQYEQLDEYERRLYTTKEELGLTWQNIADLLNNETGACYSSDRYRKEAYKYYKTIGALSLDEYIDGCLDTYCDISDNIEYALTEPCDISELDELRLMKYKLQDERTQINALYRRISREETLKEIAKDVAETFNKNMSLGDIITFIPKGNNAAILEISDWHYGIEIDNPWNKYNPDIAVERVRCLRDQVIEKIRLHDVNKLYVVNLGDLIVGRIHLPLRVQSRVDVITQIIEVSELVAQLLVDLAKYVPIEYYDCLDNHSRLEPNIKQSLDLESLTRITSWFLEWRLKGHSKRIIIHSPGAGNDSVSFKVLGHRVIGVHGHKDSPSKVVTNLTMHTRTAYDLILTAHLHHFSADEQNETLVVSNSSLMGTDDYADKLRVSAYPSQNLIIVSKESPAEAIYRLLLDKIL